MCGIVGFTGLNDIDVLHRMTHAIRHRGPDDDGFTEMAGVSLGMRRLAIVDVATGKQPISNEDRSVWTVFNGEIYNHSALRRALIQQGHIFRTSHADTETIVHLYEQYGDTWPQIANVNGMFSIALWDGNKRRLLLYRDRIGKKPLYYAIIRGQIIFASEIKAMFQHPLVSRDLDHFSLYQYFMLKNTRAPRTAFANIRQLLPGHYLIWEPYKVPIIKSYWELSFVQNEPAYSENEAQTRLFELLDDSVRLRMDCDAPYGAYLSGGVDSSAVVSLMNRHRKDRLKTFCLGYADSSNGQFEGKAQDIHYARVMSKQLGTEHYEFFITANMFAEAMPNILASFDEPFSGTISTYFLSILMKEHVKVAISGDGADELFGSYLAHRLAYPIDHWMHLKSRGIKEWRELNENDLHLLIPFDTEDRFDFLKTIAHKELAVWRSRLMVFSRSEMDELLTHDFLGLITEIEREPFGQMVASLTAHDPLNRSLEIDQLDLLPNQILPFVDRLSMSHSIEVRCPYLDYRIIELAASLPGAYKIKNAVNKYILKQAVKDLLPLELLNRPKEGFVQPIYTWMHGSLKKWCTEYLEQLPMWMFSKEKLAEITAAFLSGDQKYNAKIWSLVCFSIWYGASQNTIKEKS